MQEGKICITIFILTWHMAKEQPSNLLLHWFLQYILVRFLLVQISNWYGFLDPTNSEKSLEKPSVLKVK